MAPGANTLTLKGRYVDAKAAESQPVSVALHGFNADCTPDETTQLFRHETKARGQALEETVSFTLDPAKVKLPSYGTTARKQTLPLSDEARESLGQESATLGKALNAREGKKVQSLFAVFTKGVSARFPKAQRALVAGIVGKRAPPWRG